MPKETKDFKDIVSKSELNIMTTSKDTSKEIEMNILCKFIGKFDGSRDKLNAYLNNCRNAINLASSSQQDILLKYTLSQLEGRAESACSIKEFETWQQLEEFLKSQFGDRKHYAALLLDLQNCRQSNIETVNQFALRVESCLSKLLAEINISIPTRKKGELAGRVAAMQDLALHTFTSGLNARLSTVVRCRDPETLNEAINFAVSEEKILQTSSRQPSFNNANSFSRQSPQRPFQQNKSFVQHGVNVSNRPNDQRPAASTSGPPVCRYCKAIGHTIDVCRKREYNNKRFGKPQNQQGSRQPTTFYRSNQPIHAVELSEEQEIDDSMHDHDHDLNDQAFSPGIVREE